LDIQPVVLCLAKPDSHTLFTRGHTAQSLPLRPRPR
jgi:hypothetical protein